MPNIFTCDAEWLEKLKKEQPKVVVALWKKEGGENINKWLETLQKLEHEGTPVFVCDGDSCPGISEKLGTNEAGETIVFSQGIEKGRVKPGENIEESLSKVKELMKEV